MGMVTGCRLRQDIRTFLGAGRERGCGSNQGRTPLPSSGQGEHDEALSLESAIRRDMGTDGCLHVSLRDPPWWALLSACVFMKG